MKATARLFFLLFVIAYSFCYGQGTNLPQVIPPSPTALQFQKYGDYPVGHFTGVPGINIPLYTIKEGDIELPISLSYHASGIKPSDMNGQVGLGWVLNCGGVMTRTIVDFVDEDGRFPIDFPTQAQLDALQNYQRDNYYLFEWEDHMDTEPDIFSYNFFGNTGKFVLKRDAALTPLMLPYKPIKIQPIATTNGLLTINATDVKGMKYEFGATEWPNDAISGQYGPTRWDIKKITSPVNPTNSIVINYATALVDEQSRWNKLVDKFIADDDGTIARGEIVSGCSFQIMEDFMYYYYPESGRQIYSRFYSSEIVPTNVVSQFCQVKFIRASNNRTLNKIEIYNSKNELMQFITLSYLSKPLNRLLLKEVSFYDANGNFINKYSFNYYQESSSGFPQDFGTDYWGYYNGEVPGEFKGVMPDWPITVNGITYNTGMHSQNKFSNEDFMKVFTLNEIIYPTGGKTIFDFEANKYPNLMQNFTNANGDVGGLRIKSMTSYSDPSSLPVKKTYEYLSPVLDFVPNHKEDYSYSERIFIASAGPCQGTPCVGSVPWENFRRRYYQSEPFINFVQNGSPIVYTDVAEYFGDNINNTGRIIYGYDNSSPEYEELNYLNVQGVDLTNFWSPILRKRTKFFQNWKSGNLVSRDFQENRNGTYYTVRNEINEYEFFPGESLRGLYQERVVNYLTTGCTQAYDWTGEHALDKRVYSHLNSPACIYNYADYFIQSGEVRLKSQTTHEWDANQYLLTIIRSYEYTNSVHVQPTGITTINSKGEEIKTILKYPHDFVTQQPYGDMVNVRHIWSPVIEQSTYKNVTQFLQSTKTNYNFWYNNTWGINNANSVIVPQTLETKSGSQVNYETRLNYDAYDDKGNVLSVSKVNDAKTSYIWKYNQSFPVAEVRNARANEIFYDGFEEGDSWAGVVYDNTRSYTGNSSAKIVNPGPGELVYHSNTWLNISISTPTKFKYSGWVYSEGPGTQIFFFMKRAGETGYFTYVDDVSTTEVNKWVFLEKEFLVPADVTQLNIRLDNNSTGTVWFDDIRLYPSSGAMTSYTYTPLIGITSASDLNNRTIYYDYDESGRLILVRDNDKKIVKKICYNYSGQTENCNIFLNEPITQTFTKNNCQAGYSGTSFTLTILQGKFISTINQADANAKALTAGQAYANANGSCVVACNPTQCSSNGPAYKCVNGVCEQGVKVYTSSSPCGLHCYDCVFHYQWSDGSVSGNYSEWSPTMCAF